MVMKPEPIFECVERRLVDGAVREKTRIILLSRRGSRSGRRTARRLAMDYDRLILICGRYEGWMSAWRNTSSMRSSRSGTTCSRAGNCRR